MSPLLPLRALLLGLFGWLALGLGAYCLWEGFQRTRNQTSIAPTSQVIVDVDSDLPTNDTDPPEVRVETVANQPVTFSSRPAWPYLLAGTLLALWSFGGRWPTNFLLSSGSDPIPRVEGKKLSVEGTNGARLAIEIFEHPTGPTLIFTHGWSLDRTAWSYAVDRFRSTYRIVTWDLAGLGDSTAPAKSQYSMEQLANDLHAVVNASDNGSPIILIGHSIGGMTIQTYMRQFKSDRRIAGIGLVHTTYTDPVRTMLGASVWTAIESTVIIPLNKLVVILSPVIYVMNWQSYLNGSMSTTTRFTSFTGRQSREQLDYASRLGAKAWPAYIAKGNLAMMKFDAQDVLPKLTTPVHIIAGRHDRVTKPIASERIAELTSKAAPAYLGGGHLSIWEFHQDLHDSLESWMAGLATARQDKASA